MRFCIFAFLILLSSPARAEISINAGGASGGAIRPGWTSAACDGTTAGAMRYNSSNNYVEVCDADEWNHAAQPQQSTGSPAPVGSGYFVLSNTKWDGNLGGFAGANAKCLTEIGTTYTSWRGYTEASARGQITGSKVHAFLCEENWDVCYATLPSTTYYVAYANNGAVGGASFTTDGSGYGPNDYGSWGGANYFGGSYQYWTGASIVGSDTAWSVGYQNCSDWSQTNFYYGGYGTSTNIYATRWGTDTGDECTAQKHLICIVDP